MNKIIGPLKFCLDEIKSNWNASKNASRNKSKMLALAYFNILYFIIYSVLLLASLYYIVIGIIISPFLFVALVTTVPVLFLAGYLQKSVYPKLKENLLKDV